MSFKDKLQNLWKYLPVGSAIAYEQGISRRNEVSRRNKVNSFEVGSIGKQFLHTVYPAIVGAFLAASFMHGTPNVKKWPEITEHRERARQEGNQLYDKAFECVEQDGIKGLTSLKEIYELYSRAGISIKLDHISQERRLSEIPIRNNLKKTDLERVVASCKAEGKLE
ncbi:MAG: hypothetical protein AABW93_00250 [Nanoarchaeota archaeon]